MPTPTSLYSGPGFVYRDGKVAGRNSGLEITTDALYVVKSGIGGTAAVLVGGAAGALMDTAAIEKAKQDGKLEVFPYRAVTSLAIGSSLLNGKGLVFTMNDGAVLKVKPANAKLRDLFTQVSAAVMAANPQARIEG